MKNTVRDVRVETAAQAAAIIRSDEGQKMSAMTKKGKQWGFLRETAKEAKAVGIDADTGVCRTGLDEYLAVIFPKVSDWVHDKGIGLKYDGKPLKTRPDYRSEFLKLIVEFDGIQHYQSPIKVADDQRKSKVYESLGYTVVRIPYFIQLTKDAVFTFFGVKVDMDLFDNTIPSMGIKGQNTPAFLCCAGVERMAREFLRFPDQYQTNLKALNAIGNEVLSGAEMLRREYERLLTSARPGYS